MVNFTIFLKSSSEHQPVLRLKLLPAGGAFVVDLSGVGVQQPRPLARGGL